MNNNNISNVIDITSSINSISIKPTTTGTSYLNFYTDDYNTIGQGNGTVIQFFATPSSPKILGDIQFLNNNVALSGSSYLFLNVANGLGKTGLLYGVPRDTSGNADIYPPENLVNLGVFGGQWKSVSTYSVKNFNSLTDLTLGVNNRWVTISPGNLAGANYPIEAFNTASMSIAWNFTLGQGETTFMNNYGGTGAFDFFQRTGGATSQLLARLNPSISYIGNANGSFLVQPTITSIYTGGTTPNNVNITSWNNQGFCVFNTYGGGTNLTPNTPGFGISCNQTSGNTYLLNIAPGITWNNLNIGAGSSFWNYNGVVAATITNTSGWNNISDEREKENIKVLDTNHSLQKILACSPKHFNRKVYDTGTPIPDETRNKVCVGLLAQDVLKFNPGSLDTWKNDKITPTDLDDGTRYSLNYHDFTIHLIGAVKEQNKTITSLQSQIDEQNAKITILQSKVEELITKINNLI
jgi:hypothetical protein